MKSGYDNMTEKEMLNYYKKEQLAMEYAQDFYDRLRGLNILKLAADMLPLVCYDCTSEVVDAVKNGENTITGMGRFRYKGKQNVIIFGLDHFTDKLDYCTKQNLRHEIIHYVLWALDLPHHDTSLAFWCVAYAFFANPYDELIGEEDRSMFEAFKKMCDERYTKYMYTSVSTVIISCVLRSLESTQEEWEKVLSEIDTEYYAQGLDFSDYKECKFTMTIDDAEDIQDRLSVVLDEIFDDKDYDFTLEIDDSETTATIRIITFAEIDLEQVKQAVQMEF